MPFFVIKKGLVLLEWKYFPTPKILDPLNGGDLPVVPAFRNIKVVIKVVVTS